jgi:hypothetical protein
VELCAALLQECPCLKPFSSPPASCMQPCLRHSNSKPRHACSFVSCAPPSLAVHACSVCACMLGNVLSS